MHVKGKNATEDIYFEVKEKRSYFRLDNLDRVVFYTTEKVGNWKRVEYILALLSMY